MCAAETVSSSKSSAPLVYWYKPNAARDGGYNIGLQMGVAFFCTVLEH